MKKILSFLTIAATLGMALMFNSCGGNEPDNRKFKITVNDLTETMIEVSITPCRDDIYYCYGKMSSETFLERPRVYAKTSIPNKSPESYPEGLIKGSLENIKFENLNVREDYAIYVIEVNSNYEIEGEVEYIIVKTRAKPVAQGSLNGKFSIGDGQQVYFSRGNLQYHLYYENFRFAEHQWDTCGIKNELIKAKNYAYIDLFGWGTGKEPAKYIGGNSTYQVFDDWGIYNKILNGGNKAGVWYTLSEKEWNYLLFERPKATERLAWGMVNGINGLILLPDNWLDVNGLKPVATVANTRDITTSNWYQFKSSSDEENPNGFESNLYSAVEWALLENAGAVFLPAAGVRYDSKVYSTVNYQARYWSATQYKGDKDCGSDVELSKEIIRMWGHAKADGCPVRLVQDVR